MVRYGSSVFSSIALSILALAAIVPSTLSGCATSPGVDDVGPTVDSADGGSARLFDTDASVSCTNLECRRVECGKGATTSISGVVRDPAGVTPLYDVIVYVPNAPVAPIRHGVTCDRCGTITSGSPIATALTGTDGSFRIDNVPAGKNVPIVIQIGKWRRQVVVPHVEACANTPLPSDDTRLPRNQSEGEMPLVALSTGCDPMECLFRKIGIDDSEFTSGTGKGRVHLYRGKEGGGRPDSSSAYDLWPDAEKLRQYDVVINACECAPYPRGPAAYQVMQDYINEGGRFFGSHFHYNWFTDLPGDFETVAEWTPNGFCNKGPNFVDDSFPKGKAFAEWLVHAGASEKYGEIDLSCAPLDVRAAKPNKSQGWIYDGPTGAPSYVSFNAPTTAPPEQQCGRAVFADLHVTTEQRDIAGQEFPNGCKSNELTPQEKALEFMFFDLASCIRSDSDAPQAPPPK